MKKTLIFKRSKIPFLLLLVFLSQGCLIPSNRRQLTYYQSKVKPLLSQYCIQCHGVEETEAGLDLRKFRSILKGGQSGPAIVLGHPEKSLLLEMIVGEEMPPEGKHLNLDQISIVRRWIEMEF